MENNTFQYSGRSDDSPRIAYFDYIRVFAMLAIILTHVAAQNWDAVDVNSSDWMAFNFIDGIVRWAVPVFVMISGALFLNREDIPIKKIYSKYVLRLLIAFVVWSFIYYLLKGNSVPEQLRLLFGTGTADSITSIIYGQPHLWFVFMITGIYICLPIIKQITKNDKVTVYFLAISFVFWFAIPQTVTLITDFGTERAISIANALYSNVRAMNMNLVMSYVFYFVLGYQLSRMEFKKSRRILIYLLGIAGTIFTFAANWFVSVKTQTPVETYYGSSCVNVLIGAIAVFVFFKALRYPNKKLNKMAGQLSNWSFGVYLVHALLVYELERHGIDTLSLPISSAASTILITAAVAVGAFIISALIHFIPVLKKYIV